jgi:hypothetical protein
MSVVSGIWGAEAAKSAGQDQADAAMFAAMMQKQMYDQSRKDMMPWLESGTGAVNELSRLTMPGGSLYSAEFTPEDFLANKDPGYEFRKQEGINALAAAGAASGMYGSGNLGTALQQYGQNIASDEYQNAYNRFLNSQNMQYNRLAGISGTGMVQSQALGGLGANMAANYGNAMMQAGNAQAQGQLGAASAYGNMASRLGNQGISLLGRYLNNQDQMAMYENFGGVDQNLNGLIGNETGANLGGSGSSPGIIRQLWNWIF